jgi:hypothetical protein
MLHKNLTASLITVLVCLWIQNIRAQEPPVPETWGWGQVVSIGDGKEEVSSELPNNTSVITGVCAHVRHENFTVIGIQVTLINPDGTLDSANAYWLPAGLNPAKSCEKTVILGKEANGDRQLVAVGVGMGVKDSNVRVVEVFSRPYNGISPTLTPLDGTGNVTITTDGNSTPEEAWYVGQDPKIGDPSRSILTHVGAHCRKSNVVGMKLAIGELGNPPPAPSTIPRMYGCILAGVEPMCRIFAAPLASGACPQTAGGPNVLLLNPPPPGAPMNVLGTLYYEELGTPSTCQQGNSVKGLLFEPAAASKK